MFPGQSFNIKRWLVKCKFCKQTWAVENQFTSADYGAEFEQHLPVCPDQERIQKFTDGMRGYGYTKLTPGTPQYDHANSSAMRQMGYQYLIVKQVKGTYNPEVKCGSKCRTSKGFNCECSCGGKHHGENA